MQNGCTSVSSAQGREACRTPRCIGLLLKFDRIARGACEALQVPLTFHTRTAVLDE